MSLLFVTTNPIVDTPRPMVPTIISLEHIHIKPVKPLPKVSNIGKIICCVKFGQQMVFLIKKFRDLKEDLKEKEIPPKEVPTHGSVRTKLIKFPRAGNTAKSDHYHFNKKLFYLIEYDVRLL